MLFSLLAASLLVACGSGLSTPQPAAQAPGAPPTSQSASAPTPAASPAPTVAPTFTAEETRLRQEFRAAVVDAENAEPSEISDDLTAIDPANDELVWQAGTGRVLVATWTSWNGYDALVGQAITLTRETWVTAVPELQSFCQSYEAEPEEVPLTLRLEQLLGLPPQNGKTRIVQLWVPTDGLFRPSPDPEITDTTAQLEMPDASAFASEQDYNFSRDWFNLQRSLSYDEKNGYPWTRLGYTYDWGDPENEIGLSEFVIWAQTPIAVDAVYSTEEYCQP
jgi:hypothetical protein